MSEANKTQIGGTHYKTGYEHWDFVIDHMENRYIEGQIAKYVTRWRQKNGIADLRKARHFVTKLLEAVDQQRIIGFAPRADRSVVALREYIEVNGLWPIETKIVRLIASWDLRAEILEVADLVDSLIRDEEARLARLDAIKAGAADRAGELFSPTRGYVNQDPGA